MGKYLILVSFLIFSRNKLITISRKCKKNPRNSVNTYKIMKKTKNTPKIVAKISNNLCIELNSYDCFHIMTNKYKKLIISIDLDKLKV